MKLNAQEEPVRLGGWVALLVGIGLNVALLWSTGADVEQIVGAVAIMALTSIGGLEWARSQVYAPETYRRELDEVASAEAALGDVTVDDVDE